ncbi:hypothetical protein V6472_004707 [Vibrio parahaemolyticus]
MQEADKVIALVHLSTTHRAVLSQRYASEWKVVIAICGFLLTVVNFDNMFGDSLKVNQSMIKWLLVLSSVVVVISMYYLWRLHRSNIKNRMCAQVSENRLIQLVDGSFDQDLEYDFDKNYKWYSFHEMFSAQLLIVLSFFFLMGFVLLSQYSNLCLDAA